MTYTFSRIWSGLDMVLWQVKNRSMLAEALQSNGMVLAAVIGVGMILALLFVIWKIFQAFSEVRLHAPAWLDAVIPFLSILGLGVALYLTYIEGTATRAICGPIGDCNAVQQSSYAKIFGIIPVGLIGAIGYIAILAAWFYRRQFSRNPGQQGRLLVYAPVLIFGMAVFGTIYSIYLTYLELFVIRAVCIWCLSSAVLITLIMLASLPACTHWLAGSEEE